jgi:hypothetical protein
VLFLSGLHLRTLRNPGNEPAVLLAISRRRHPSAGEPVTNTAV